MKTGSLIKKFVVMALIATVSTATSLMAGPGPMHDGVMMRDGKMMMMKDGKTMMMEKDMTMSDGTKCMMNGECIMKDGKKMMMKDGDMVTMDGKMMHHKMKHEAEAETK